MPERPHRRTTAEHATVTQVKWRYTLRRFGADSQQDAITCLSLAGQARQAPSSITKLVRHTLIWTEPSRPTDEKCRRPVVDFGGGGRHVGGRAGYCGPSISRGREARLGADDDGDDDCARAADPTRPGRLGVRIRWDSAPVGVGRRAAGTGLGR